MAVETQKTNIKALIARKEFLFQELTRIHDIVKKKEFNDELDADIQLSSLARHEATFSALVNEILTANTFVPQGEGIKMSDLGHFQTLFDNIRKHCLKCKINQNKKSTNYDAGGVKLPKIHLPTFSGNVSEWSSFIEQYNVTIHTKPISKIEKLTYLKSTLSGEAAAIVRQYEMNEKSYDLAYDALIKRYGNPRILANHFVNQILGFKFGASTAKPYVKFMEVHRSATASLRNLDISDLADYILFEIVYRNLPIHQQKSFDKECDSTQIPTLNDLFSYVDKLARTEELHSNLQTPLFKANPKYKNQQVLLGVTSENPIRTCVYCKQEHSLYRCSSFKTLDISKKHKVLKKYGVCQQCLGIHKNKCLSQYSCKHCQAKNHHTFLCPLANEPKESQTSSGETCEESNRDLKQQRSCNACLTKNTTPVLLGTIKGKIMDAWGTPHEVRVVCDTGSQVNLISSSLVSRLGVKTVHTPIDVQSVAQNTTKVLGLTNIKLQALNDQNVCYKFNAAVLQTICSDLPTDFIATKLPDKIANIQLADPEFRIRKSVDILLGAEACMDILSTQEPTVIKAQPTAVRTIFGYVLMGRMPEVSAATALTLCTTTLEKTLRDFWEAEAVENKKLSNDDIECEEHFRKSHQRDGSGRYIVRLPFEENATPLGNNLNVGIKSLSRLEARFKKNPELKGKYSEIIQDYLDQGHMASTSTNESYVLPHHCVYKDSSSTAVRVVFNASSEDDTGLSLNSRLRPGPKLQNELPRILINFRFHEVAIQTDIKQMFRNILLHPEDRKFQRILWRWSADEEIKQFSLNTVTFGITSSPYLAQRVLKQLVLDEGSPYPEASEAVLQDTFMDDFVTGAASVTEAQKLQADLRTLLRKGGFELRKWSSSHQEVLDQIPEDHIEKNFIFPTGEKGVKILGLLWDKTSDSLRYHVSEFQSKVVTKRSILSYIARTWDCLGLVSPVVLKCKIFLQRLWLLQVDWDDTLPSDLSSEWLKLTSEMFLLKELKIPRKLRINGNQLRIVGFSDASEAAMAANVYLHITSPEGVLESHLLMSKTKLAPLKNWTIPRLELTAAVLLATLVDHIKRTKLKDVPTYLFTDSQIVLAWLRLPPHNLKIFVANRVILIKETLPEAVWNFVPGDQNPADISSRGLQPSQIINNGLWWNGPEFLKEPFETWDKSKFEFEVPDSLLELKTPKIMQTLTVQTIIDGPVSRYIEEVSSLIKLQRVIAFICRYINNLRAKDRATGILSTDELKSALLVCVRLTQQKYFASQIEAIRSKKDMKDSKLQKLSPFLDESQLLRAGGRIRRAESLSEEAKHPLILPKECQLSSLICDFYHRKLLHAGPRTTQAAIQQRFWILSLRQLLRKRIRLCLRCFKLSAVTSQPIMGDLPHSRVNISRPFTDITLDFGGPLYTKDSQIRKSTKHKSYLCVFVCMATKAVHIETVSELSSKAFIAALHRFISRRGLPRNVYSDCGRNFVGAARELRDVERMHTINDDVKQFAAHQGIFWHFAPPYAPNFNGLAEAAIKSAKRLLIRQIGEEVFTFEELATILCRVEAVLNSRPLVEVNTDANENVLYLSPAHFLIGDQLLFPPEIPLEVLTLKSRWERIQQKCQLFWRRWSKEYVHTMIQRQRWTKAGPNPKVGQVVFIKAEELPPLQWPLGRISALHYGEDGVARVATIQCKNGKTIRRLVSQLMVLPQNE